MAVSSSLAVGTSHGLVLIFDPSQALKLVLGTQHQGQQYGPVSALDFNGDMTRLLVGHAKGALTMWDLGNGKCIRTITDAHVPGTPVLHVKFLDDPTQVFLVCVAGLFLLCSRCLVSACVRVSVNRHVYAFVCLFMSVCDACYNVSGIVLPRRQSLH